MSWCEYVEIFVEKRKKKKEYTNTNYIYIDNEGILVVFYHSTELKPWDTHMIHTHVTYVKLGRKIEHMTLWSKFKFCVNK